MIENNITIDDLLLEVSKYIKDKKDIDKIKEAYNYASLVHEGDFRLSGETQVNHVLAVALILTTIHIDTPTIIAGLLHEVIRYGNRSIHEMEEKFGNEIAFLVDDITKINRLSLNTSSDSNIQMERKILVGLSKDARVIIIKLADRLHNMRTLWALSPNKQKEKANETLEILVPIAHRMGINHIKSELENLSLRYLKPDVYYNILEKLNKTKQERDLLVNKMVDEVSILLNDYNIKHEIKGRSKSIYSIYKKLNTGRDFNDIYDILGLRIFVQTEQDCYLTLGIIHSKYKSISKRFKDFIAMPKTNLYQSIHTSVFGIDGNLFEIQIRTYEMDEIAEHGIAAHWTYKEKGSNVNALKTPMDLKLEFFKSVLELDDEDISNEDFVNTVKDEVLQNNIYVFTPKGDVVEMPYGSTPIDFAYKVHSEIGNKMIGAIVNNKIVPLDYILKDEDIIKINTSKSSKGPNLEWLSIARTTQAKNKIKAFFREQEKDIYIKKGEAILLKTLRKKRIEFNTLFNDEVLNKVFSELKINDINDLYYLIATSKISIINLLNIINNDSLSKEELILNKAYNATKKEINIKNDIIVEGIDCIKVNIKSCCNPIPNDDIIGYITKGNGISVHRVICPNISNEERTINVSWNPDISRKYSSAIIIYTKEQNKSLIDIINRASNNSIVVDAINTISKNKDIIIEIHVLVSNTIILDKFIQNIKSLKYVERVERLIK